MLMINIYRFKKTIYHLCWYVREIKGPHNLLKTIDVDLWNDVDFVSGILD